MVAKGPWTEAPTPQLRSRLASAANESRLNGIELLEEAKLLAAHERFARAAALAVLAEEEFAKGFLLINCVQQGRWDSAIFQALTHHGSKQALNGMVQELAKGVAARLRAFAQRDAQQVIPRPWPLTDAMPSAEELERARLDALREREKRPRDRIKQAAFYVDVSRDGSVRTPSSVGPTEWEACLRAALAAQAWLRQSSPGLWSELA